MDHLTRRNFLRLTSTSAVSATLALVGLGYQTQLREAIAANQEEFYLPFVSSSPRRNILFIVVDDLRPELGCYGHPAVISPNIDALAASGTLFTRAYCQIAVCAASRASVLSGYRPDSTGIFGNSTPLRSVMPDVLTLPQHFRNNGYTTLALGKVYHHYHEDPPGWDVDFSTVPRHTPAQPSSLEAPEGNATLANDVPDNTYHDGALADRAISTLQTVKDRPFFLAVGFKKPHLPFQAPLKYWNLYDRDSIPLPSPDHPDGAPNQAFTNWGELRRFDDIPAEGDLDEAKSLELIHGYWACVSYVDAQIGRLLDELDRLSLRDNTTIILWVDHGFKLGEYGDWSKHTNFEYDTHCPMIICDPDQRQGQQCDALVEFVDIYPTLAELASLDIPIHCEGKSVRPLLEDPTISWKIAALSQWRRNANLMGHSLRTEQWRYTEWRTITSGKLEARELYDHANGPRATKNVVDQVEYAERVAALEETLAIYRATGKIEFPPPVHGEHQ